MFFNKVNYENECFCKLIVLGLPHPVARSDGTSFCFCCHSFHWIKIPGYDIFHPDGIYLIKNNAGRSFLIERPAYNYKPNVIGLIGVKFCFLIYNCFFEVGFCFLPAGGRRPKRGFLP